MLLETQTTFTVLGIRFWDASRNVQVHDGLHVTARPDGINGRSATAFLTPSGNYAFHKLPGLSNWEYPVGSVPPPPAPADASRFIIEVLDLKNRFLPTTFQVDLPLPNRGLFPMAAQNGTPGDSSLGAYLFSAPSRLVSPGDAVIRAHLVDKDNGRSVPFAILEVRITDTQPQQRWDGISDTQGNVLVQFPMPSLTHFADAAAAATSLAEKWWRINVRVHYQPNVLTLPPGSNAPDLRSIYDQGQGTVWPHQTGPPRNKTNKNLYFRQECILRTDDSSDFLISPAA